MVTKNISQEFRLKEADKIRNYFIEEIKQNELTSKTHRKVCKILNYTEHLLTFASIVTGCVPVSVFDSLIGIPVAIASFSIAIKISISNAGITKV